MAKLGDRIARYSGQLPKTNQSKDYADGQRLRYFNYYLRYFRDIVTNFYEWQGLPEGVSAEFIERTLFYKGHAAFYFDDTLGYIVLEGASTGNINYYHLPTEFNPINQNYNRVHIPTRLRAITDLGVVPNQDGPFCVLIGNSMFYESYFTEIELFCERLADIEQTIDLNRRAQVTPFILRTTNKQLLTVKNIFAKLSNYEPVIALDKRQDLEDSLDVLRTDAPFLLDKLHDEKNRIIGQALTFIGLNSNSVDKAERLVRAEANANLAEVQSNVEIGLRARRKAAELINHFYGLNVTVDVSRRLDAFNDGDFDYQVHGGDVNV